MDLVTIFLRCIEQHGISQHEVSRIVGFRSDNQMTRILQHKVSQQKMLEFGRALLTHAAELGLTAQETEMISNAMQHISAGYENMYAFERFCPLLSSQGKSTPKPSMQLVSENGESLGSLEAFTQKARRTEAVVLNCANASVMYSLSQCAQRTALSVEYYYLAESSVMRTVGVLETTWPYLFCKWFHPYSVHLKECRLSSGLWNADIFFLRMAMNETFPVCHTGQWVMFLLQSDQRAILLGKIDCNPKQLLHREDAVCYSLYNDAAQRDYVQYLQYIRRLEHRHRIFRIKPDLGFELIPIDIQIEALKGTSFPSDYADLVGAVTEIARQRYQESLHKTTRQYHIVSKAAMIRFAQTGMLSDHFWGFRAYTPEERVRIFTELYTRMKNSSLFRLRFLRDDVVLKPREVIWYEDYGVCILMENPDYRIEEHRELLLRDRLFSTWFGSFFRDCFCKENTDTPEESLAQMEQMIRIAQA